MKRIIQGFLLCVLLGGASSMVLAEPVDINTADAATLAAELSGVGPALAEAIVRDREQNGRFTSPESLMRVRGIGERVVEANREKILVQAPAAETASE